MLLVLGLSPWLTGLLVVLFLAICVIMVLTVLIQKPQGGGLASAFGGGAAGSGQTAFGTKTGDALTIFTIIVFGLYVLFAVLLNFASRDTGSQQPPAITSPEGPDTAPSTAGTPATRGTAAPATTGAPAATPPAPANPAANPPANAPATSPTPAPSTPAPSAPSPATPPAPSTSPGSGPGL